jgi:hypothetical protein
MSAAEVVDHGCGQPGGRLCMSIGMDAWITARARIDIDSIVYIWCG